MGERLIDEKVIKIRDVFEGKKFCLFGVGKIGQYVYKTFKTLDLVDSFIDNDPLKQNQKFESTNIISFDDYLNLDNKGPIVICCGSNNQKTIKQQLEDAGLVENEDYYLWEKIRYEVMPCLAFALREKSYIDTAQICVTERCTLRCKKCAHGCYAVPRNSEDISIHMVKKTTDYYFKYVDYTDNFHLIGGEPFLYKDIDEAIRYIGTKYRRQMNKFCITTNGTIIPDEQILKTAAQFDVEIYISNYSKTLSNLQSKYLQFEKACKCYGVSYELYDEDFAWTDYGFDVVDRGCLKNGEIINGSAEKLKTVFNTCKTPCREVRGSRLYYCVSARAIHDNLGFDKKIGEKDYLDLKSLGNSLADKKKILQFELGEIEKGYLDMCNYCYGNERFTHLIPPAEQL